MAYNGKFVDRSPCIRPAGQVTYRKEENVVSCLEHFVTDYEDKPFVYKTQGYDKLTPKKVNIYKGFFSDMRECLQPEKDLGHFEMLKNEFKDTVYDSYWKKEVGRVPDSSPMLPAGMDPTEVTFGKTTKSGLQAGELINPTFPFENSPSIHELYKRSHQDYGPGEQISRNYFRPFNRERIYGIQTPCDPSGGCIKKVMNTGVYDKRLVSKILSDYKTRTTCLVGKVHEPNDNISLVPRGHAFGKSLKTDYYGAGELLKDSGPNLEKYHLYQEIAHVNVLRNQIAKKQPHFPHRDFLRRLHKFDLKNTGLILLKEAYKVLQEFEIFPDNYLFEAFLARLGVLSSDDLVAYEKMADLLNVNVMFPVINKIDDIPSECLHFETTNREAQRYHANPRAIQLTESIPTAGIPPKQHISMYSLVSPANYSQLFLEPKDFFSSRSPEYFRKLLNRVGSEISDEAFHAVWNRAKDHNGCVCVNSFLSALRGF